MTIIGNLETVKNNGETEHWGTIKTLKLNLAIRLVENRDFKSGPNAPDFLVLLNHVEGDTTQIGTAWLKIPNKPNSKVAQFISLSIDDPSMDKPLNVAAFPKEGGKWDIAFSRPRQDKTT